MYLLSLFNSRLRRFFENINVFNISLAARQLVLQAQFIAHENRKKTYITNLKDKNLRRSLNGEKMES